MGNDLVTELLLFYAFLYHFIIFKISKTMYIEVVSQFVTCFIAFWGNGYVLTSKVVN